MAKGSSPRSPGSPATAGGSPTETSNSASQRAVDVDMDTARSVQFEDDNARGQRSDEDHEEKEEADDDVKSTAELLSEVEELSLQVSRMGNPRPVERNLVTELNASADDDDDEDQGAAQGERPPLTPRAIRNADTSSANKVLARLGEEMRTQSEWMMMFAPVTMAQAKWLVLEPELTQPINSTSINQLIEDTVLLLRAMGFRCNSRPNSLTLGGWSWSRAGTELSRWKRRIRIDFGLERAPSSRRLIQDRSAKLLELNPDPSEVPLPKTPETESAAKAEKFRSTVGTPYFEDSKIASPEKKRPDSGRYDHLYDASDDAELGGDDYYNRCDQEESVKDQIRRLSYDDDERDDTKYLEIRTHFSLDKIAEFDGKRYRSDASHQWLKRFIYEIKGTRMPQNSWCEPFSLSLGRAAKSWYRQLPSKTQQRWNLLNEAFLDYYCSQFDQSARTRYYSASRKENEPICDFLIRLNGYARTANIQYEKGGADAADHVEQFLLNCGDDEVMDLLYPLQLADIQRVEQIINKKILGEKRKKQRDRMISNRNRDTRRGEYRREDRRYDRRESRRDDRREPRRDDRRSRRDESRERRVTVADASVDDLYHGVDSRQSSRRINAPGSSSSAGSGSDYSDSESDQDQNYVDAGAGRMRRTTRRNVAEMIALLAETIRWSVNAAVAEMTRAKDGRSTVVAAEVTLVSDRATARVLHVAASTTRRTFATAGANSANKFTM